MTVKNMMDPLEWLRQHLAELDPDLVRSMLATFAEKLMSADAQTLCSAGFRERTPARTNSRKCYRSRDWDTRVGTIELQIPKLHHDSYYPRSLLEPRRHDIGSLVNRNVSGSASRCRGAALAGTPNGGGIGGRRDGASSGGSHLRRGRQSSTTAASSPAWLGQRGLEHSAAQRPGTSVASPDRATDRV